MILTFIFSLFYQFFKGLVIISIFIKMGIPNQEEVQMDFFQGKCVYVCGADNELNRNAQRRIVIVMPSD